MNLIAVIEDLLNTPPRCGSTHIIAIDGPAGGGKTTLSKELARALSIHRKVDLLHLDDIYAGWDLALGQTLTDSLSKILESISIEKTVIIPIYDWITEKFNSTKEIQPCDLIILEGVGSAQRIVREFATATIWVDIDPQTGLRRVLDRDGGSIKEHMIRWQEREQEHFRADATRQNADFVLSTL